MKKKILLFASAALLLVGCAKEQIAVTESNGDTVEVTVNAHLLNGEQTKASWDSDGAGSCVNHWIMEVYDKQDKLFDRQEKTAQSGLTNTFSVILIKNQEYKFAFWADKQGSYKTEKLTEVQTVSNVAGLDSRDAFFANIDYTPAMGTAISAKLYRPFAQINIVTLDLKKIWDQMVAGKTISEEEGGNVEEFKKFEPKKLKLSCKTYNEFNVLDGTASDVQDTELTLESCYADFSAHAAKTTIFMDYLFADKAKGLKDLKFTFKSNEVAISYDFANIPLQRNYRTNISGNLLSNDATVNVEIIPIWKEPDYEVHIFEPSYGDITSAIENAEPGDKIAVNGKSFIKANDGFCYADPDNREGRLVYMKSVSTPGSSTASTKFIPNTGSTPIDLQTLLLGSKGRLEGPGAYLNSTDVIALPEGTVYYKNDGSGIVDTYGDITFLGAGQDKTVIAPVQTSGNTNYRFFRMYNRYAKCVAENIIYNYNFENLTIDGSGESHTSANCFVVTCYNIKMNLKNVTIKNFGGSAFSVWANDSLNAAGYSGDWTGFYFGGYDGNGKPLYYPTKAMNCGVEINLESCTVKDNGRLIHYDAAPYVSGNNAGGYGFIHLNYDGDCTIVDNGEVYDVVSSVKKGEGNCLLNGVDVWPADN